MLPILPCFLSRIHAGHVKKTVYLVIVHIAVFEAWETQLDLHSLQSVCSFPASRSYLLIDLPSYSDRPTIPSAAKKTSKCKNCFMWIFIPLRKKWDSWHIQEHLTSCQVFFAYMTFWPANQHSISCFEIKNISIPESFWHYVLILFMVLY